METDQKKEVFINDMTKRMDALEAYLVKLKETTERMLKSDGKEDDVIRAVLLMLAFEEIQTLTSIEFFRELVKNVRDGTVSDMLPKFPAHKC